MYLAMLWHMHQPCYKDPQSGCYLMPWTWMHGLRDYFDMVARLERFPHARCNVNVVPSLLSQLEEYQRPDVCDSFLRLAQKPAAELEPAEQDFLLQHFFSLNWDRMVRPHPRYWELLQRRQSAAMGDACEGGGFSVADFRDLQLWFYLGWCGDALRRDPTVRRLIAQGRNFSEGDKQELFAAQKRFLAGILPLYRRLHEGGRIELGCSPLYHPILPLLCDARSARVAMPSVPLPEPQFRHPEDGQYQVREALRALERMLGVSPQGMWPSEGALSPEAAGLMAEAGLRWTASDETVLQRSLDDGRRDTHFFPYRYRREGEEIAIFFRDRTLSDLIGFTYSHWPEQDAAADLMLRLTALARTVAPDAVVSIILDGENAWEYYPEGGRVFWDTFFTLLEGQQEVRPVTFSEYLTRHPPAAELPALHSGSWIGGDFRIWMGHPEKNRAWELLEETRATAAGRTSPAQAPEVWEQIYIAEGSDWFWWYGDDHHSAYRAGFDLLFRKRLQCTYEKMGLPVPASLFQAISKDAISSVIEPPLAPIHPTLDGRVTDYFEWLGAGRISLRAAAGAMHPVDSVLRQVLFGLDSQNFFLRMDLMRSAEVTRGDAVWKFEVSFLKPRSLRMEAAGEDDGFSAWLVKEGDRQPFSSFVLHKIIELAIPRQALECAPGQEVQWTIQIYKDGRPVERWPRTEYFSFTPEGD